MHVNTEAIKFNKQHATVDNELTIVTCPTYPDKFTRDTLLHRLYL